MKSVVCKPFGRRPLVEATTGESSVFMTLKRAVEIAASRSLLSSGSRAIDTLLDGGLRTGEVVEVFGASNTGKTQLAMQATLSSVAAGNTAAFVDTEGTFRPERLAAMAKARGMEARSALASVYSMRADTTDQQIGAIGKIRENPDLARCRMVVVDTVSRNFTLEYGGTRLTPRRQTILGDYLGRLVRDAYLFDRVVLLTNRVASVGLGPASRVTDIGGETLRHAMQKVVRLQRRGNQIYASRVDAVRPQSVTRITELGVE